MKDKTIKINLLYNFMYQVLAIAVPIIITPYTSRVLGAEGVGNMRMLVLSHIILQFL